MPDAIAGVSKPTQENSARTDRRRRLGEALKANIKRRKSQLRARGEEAASKPAGTGAKKPGTDPP